MEWLNPLEWVAWLYGRFFQRHTWTGGIIVVTVFALTGLIVWVRAVDKYKEDHPFPKVQTVAESPAGNLTKMKKELTAPAPAETQTSIKKKSHPVTASPVKPTHTVTNPVGSIVNQDSPNLGTQTVNNNYGPPPPSFELTMVKENEKLRDDLYQTQFRLVVKTQKTIPYLYLRAESPNITNNILFEPDRPTISSTFKRNPTSGPGFFSTNIEGVSAGPYIVTTFSAKPENITLTYDPNFH